MDPAVVSMREVITADDPDAVAEIRAERDLDAND